FSGACIFAKTSADNVSGTWIKRPPAQPASTNKARIHIIYYSMYGHIAAMAKSILKGVEAGCAGVGPDFVALAARG
ncbi:unnamed protein product, partial [Rotaria socialis]